MKILILVAAITLTACVTASDVMPIGNGKYMLTGRANGGMNAGKGAPAAVQKATAYCANMHKTLVVESTDSIASFGTESTNLTFKCE